MKIKKNHNTNIVIDRVAEMCIGHSGADIKELCREASLGPIRQITDITAIDPSQVRPIG